MIVLLSGKQGSGKTTLMNEVKKVLEGGGYDVRNVIFADTIYKIHDFAISLLSARGVERDIVKDGFLLQFLGTEWGRKTIDENIWVRCLLGEIQSIRNLHPESKLAFIVSDCRFVNEFDGVEGALKIRLEASRELRKARCSQWRENDVHISETDLDRYATEGMFDLYVDTERDLERSVTQIVQAIEGKSTRNYYDEVFEKYYLKPLAKSCLEKTYVP